MRRIRSVIRWRCIPQRLNAKGQTKRLFKRRCRARKPKHFKAQYPGHCIALLDTIVRYQHGVRRYVLTAIDVYTRMATRESPVIEQWLTYPKCPKMNAHIERFNRTVQEDCIDHAEDLLFADTEAFND